MPATLVPNAETFDLKLLIEHHDCLLDKFAKDRDLIRIDDARRTDFVNCVDLFLDQLRQSVPQVRTTAAADLLGQFASEWQTIFTAELRIPRDISDIFRIGRAPDDCEPTLTYAKVAPLQREIILERIRERAFLISKDWKLNWLKRQLFAFSARPELIHKTILTPPVRTPEDDWREACVFFACDVVDARVDLALQLGVCAFEFLENVWLEDMKRLKAYFFWEAAQPNGELADANEFYGKACDDIRARLGDNAIKSGAESFSPIADWLKKEILDHGQLDTQTRPYARCLVEKKAWRLWNRTKCEDSSRNWQSAESYARSFYENLIPAVVDRNRKAIDAIRRAVLDESPANSTREIVNALEVAVVAYFC